MEEKKIKKTKPKTRKLKKKSLSKRVPLRVKETDEQTEIVLQRARPLTKKELDRQETNKIREIIEWAEMNLHTGELYKRIYNKLAELALEGNLKAIELFFRYSGLERFIAAPVDQSKCGPTNIQINIAKE